MKIQLNKNFSLCNSGDIFFEMHWCFQSLEKLVEFQRGKNIKVYLIITYFLKFIYLFIGL